jgi:hypothetical protein
MRLARCQTSPPRVQLRFLLLSLAILPLHPTKVNPSPQLSPPKLRKLAIRRNGELGLLVWVLGVARRNLRKLGVECRMATPSPATSPAPALVELRFPAFVDAPAIVVGPTGLYATSGSEQGAIQRARRDTIINRAVELTVYIFSQSEPGKFSCWVHRGTFYRGRLTRCNERQ